MKASILHWVDVLSAATTQALWATEKMEEQSCKTGIPLSNAYLEMLQDISKGKDENLFKLFIAAISIIQKRYSNSPEVVIHSPGFRENDGPVFFHLKPDDHITIRQLLKDIHEQLVAGAGFVGYQFSYLQNALKTRGIFSPALLATGFSMEGFARSGQEITGEGLSIMLRRHSQGISLDVSMKAGVRPGPEAIGASLLQVLSAITVDLDSTIGSISLLDGGQLDAMLETCHGAPAADAQSVATVFRQTAQKFSADTALISGDVRLDYNSLYTRASALASQLQRTAGFAADDIVALHFSPGQDMVIAMLGVILAGGAYLPLDPGWPPSRLDFMLQDAGCRLLLTDTDDRKGLNEHVLLIPSDSWQTHVERDWPTADVSPEAAAYVIYTSGTTGQPKGVCVPQRALTNYCSWLGADMHVAPGSSSVLLSSYAYDLGYTALWGMLLNGGTIHLVPENIITAPPEILQYVNRHRISLLKLTPSLFHLFMHALAEEETLVLPYLQKIFLGGEAINYQDVARFWLRCPQVEFINHYGPTETTIGSIVKRVSATDINNGKIVIGRPIRGLRAYILGTNGRLLPAYAIGEICIGGAGLSAGYLHQPALTVEKFITDQYQSTQKIYRTGDLGWRDDQGNLIFVGRKDSQVKVNGHRIDLKEVDYRLSEIPGIQQACTVIYGTLSGQVLVSFYVSRYSLEDTAIRERLRQWLPEFAVPVAIIHLDTIPLTPNGKTDNSKLSKIYEQHIRQQGAHTAELSGTQAAIAAVWSSLLGIPVRDVQQSFFALGGHSLLAVRLVMELNRTFGANLRLADIFAAPTIGQQEPLLQQVSQAVSIGAVPPADSYPLTLGQLGIWFGQKTASSGVLYNSPRIFFADGHIDPETLRKALDELVQRHEILRTVFRETAGMPRQIILHAYECPIAFEYRDLRLLDPEERELLVLEASGYVFDLTTGPLCRLSLFILEEDKYQVVLVQHHIISDGWTTDLLIRELFIIYDRLTGGRAAVLPALTLQYKDFAAWQANALQDGTFRQAEEFWSAMHPEAPEPVEIPYKKQNSEPGNKAGMRGFELDETMFRRLSDTAAQSGVSVFTVLFTAINVLLHRLSGQEEITVGLPAAGRDYPGLENIAGFLVNILPLRSSFGKDQSFRDCLQATHAAIAAALRNQWYPYSRINEGKWKVNILVDHIMLGHGLQPEGNITITPAVSNVLSSKVDIRFMVLTGADHASIQLEYDTALFDPQDVQTISRCLLQLLDGIFSDINMPLASCPLIDADMQQKLVTGYNQVAAFIPAKRGMIDLLLEKVSLQPDAVAVQENGKDYTYGQVFSAAAFISGRLKDYYCVGKNEVVALVMKPGLLHITVMLGTMMAGAVFMPVDADNPTDYIYSLLAEANVKVVISATTETEKLGFPDEMSWHLSAFPDEKVDYAGTAVLSGPADPLYLIYTSGSTGRKKGVLVNNYSFVNYISWANQYYFADETPLRFACFTSVAFDLTLTSIFCPLLKGGTIVTFDSRLKINEQLTKIFQLENKVNAVKMTPSHLTLLQHLPVSKTGVNVCILGGEAVHPESLAKLRQLNPAMRIFNEYGPTEATVGCTVAELDPVDKVDIGKPIANTRIYILGENHQPCPEMVWGELYIAGDCLAAGYYQQAEATSQKFLPDPFQPAERMYRSGDIGRWTNNGRLELKGRSDDQVKIRGHRIELREIERLIMAYPGVSAAALLCREQNGIKEIWAYVQADDAEISNLLRKYLAARLPVHMVPAFIIYIKSLPLTINGKIDKESLEKLSAETTEKQQGLEEKESTLDKIMAICREILGRNDIKPTDNFFDIGGHSLLSIQLGGRIYKTMDVLLEINVIFENPILEDYAAIVDASKRNRFQSIAKAPENIRMKASHAQKRIWILSQIEASSRSQHVQQMFRLPQKVSPKIISLALNNVISRHEILRTVFVYDDGEVYQRVLQEGLSDKILVERKFHHVSQLEQWATADRQQLFDLEKGPLIRACLASVDNEQFLCFTFHHIIMDQHSLQVFLRDFQAYCARYAIVGMPAPKALFLQHRDYTYWHYSQLEGVRREPFISFWRERLSGALPETRMPADFQRTVVKTYNGRRMFLEIDSARTAAIKQACRRYQLTSFIWMLSCFYLTIAKLTGESDLIVGIPVSGRAHDELEDQIGLFVNALPARMKIRKDMPLQHYLRHVKQEILAISTKQIYPVDLLMSDLGIARPENGGAPLFEVVFNWITAGAATQWTGDILETSSLAGHVYTAKHEFLLGGQEYDDEILINIEYAVDLFTQETINYIFHEYLKVIEQMTSLSEKDTLGRLLTNDAQQVASLTFSKF